MTASHSRAEAAGAPLEEELGRAGLVVDKSIDHMLRQGMSPMAVASALLGGSMCLLARTMGDEAVLHVLHNAAAGVRSGELRGPGCG